MKKMFCVDFFNYQDYKVYLIKKSSTKLIAASLYKKIADEICWLK